MRQDPNELKTTVDGLSEEVRILELQNDQTSLTQLREPVNFCIHVATNGTGDECSKNTSERRPIVVGGTSYAYDAAPAEQAQRISTVSSAARSMQFALALAASVPSASVGAEAGLGTLNSVASKIDARERAPLVVGFSEAGRATARSDTDDANAMSGAAEPYGAAFGWVFGPRVNFEGDGNTLALAHTAASHQVVADLSLPAWWPYVSLEVRSEWAGSGWIGETPDLVQRKTPQQAMNVRLPTTKADLDLLTDHLFAEATGIEITQPTIATVTPATVVLGCAPLSVLLVEGEDLWRGSEAYFLGTRHQSLQVLPDMGGLRITFDLSDAAVAADAAEHELTVWTRRGPARKTVNLIRGNTACPGDSVGTGPQISLAQQHFIEGGPFALALPGGLPEAYHALAFYAQLAESGDSGNRKVTPEGNAPQIAAGGRDLTVPQWSLDGNPFGAPGRPVAGDLLHVGLELKPTPAKTRYIRAAGEVVYYPTGGGKASRSPDEVPNPASRIEITLPVKATKAFPALLHPETRLTAAATPNGGSAIELRSQRNVQQLLDDGVAEPAKLLVSINDFSPSGALEPHRTKDITIAFEFAGPPGAHLPAIEGTVKLAKTP